MVSKISKKLIQAIKLDERRQYEIAWAAGVNPTTLSQMITGYIRPKVGDRRVVRVGRVLGIDEKECFEKNQ
jgi:hypothetical protein